MPPTIVEPIDKEKILHLDLEYRNKQATTYQRKTKIEKTNTNSVEFSSKSLEMTSALSSSLTTTSTTSLHHKHVSSISNVLQSAAISNDSGIIYTKTAKKQDIETPSITLSSKLLTVQKESTLSSLISASMISSITDQSVSSNNSNQMTTSSNSSCTSMQTSIIASSTIHQITSKEKQNIESVINQLEATDSKSK